jgi:serine/threonine protein phosphatase PrpC
MTFSGDYKDQTARINEIVGLTDDIGSLYQDVKNLESYEYTAVADGLSTAHKMVNEYTEDGHKKVIVLFTDGISNIVSSDLNSSRVLPTYNGPGLATNYVAVFNQAMAAATTQATAIKNDNITLIVIGYDVKRYTSYYSTITGWATTGLYYDAESGDELVDTFSDLFLDLCEKEEEETSGAGAGTANP